METSTYFLGRVVKVNLTQTQLMDAIVNANAVNVNKFDWAITDVVDRRAETRPYVFGVLSKYSREGQVKRVDLEKRSQVDLPAKNLLVASAPFVYLPEYSGIAYMRVWNDIQDTVFARRFKAIIEQTLGGVLVDCSIEPISDYREFVLRIQGLSQIKKIHAKVNPPNPHFGRMWGPLNQYMGERNASEVKIVESAEVGSLKTRLVEIVNWMIKSAKSKESPIPQEPATETKNDNPIPENVGIADAALLMAADGYGTGAVVGKKDKETVTVRTSDAQLNFPFPKEPDPLALAEETRRRLQTISIERDMGH